MMNEDVSNPSASSEKLLKKLEQKNKEIEILKEVFSQIRTSLDLDFILNKILELLDHYFCYKHSMILLEDEGNYLKVVASYGYPRKGIGAKADIGKGVIGTAAKRKQIIRLGNIRIGLQYMRGGTEVENVEDEIIIKLPGLSNPMSQVAIPLMNKDEFIGVLSVESEKVNVFNDEDELIINLIASQAAIAIHNARMFETERKRFEEIQQINKKLSDLTITQQETLSLFIRYVPEQVVKKALKERPESIFEGEQVDIGVLFCDIRNFTPLSERLTPNEVVSLLNCFYSNMSRVIKQHGGVINQFVGDEIFVIFGAPVPVVNCEEKTVLCAIGMINQLEILNKEMEANLGFTIKVGIGANYGPVITGNLGCEDKIEYSVTGDTVNTAKRIETLTKENPNSVLISESLYAKTKHLVEAKAWEPVTVKGKQEKVTVYQVTGLNESID